MDQSFLLKAAKLILKFKPKSGVLHWLLKSLTSVAKTQGRIKGHYVGCSEKKVVLTETFDPKCPKTRSDILC